MVDKRLKTVSYRRAEWLAPDPAKTVEKYLRNANTKLPTLKNRWVLLGEQTVRLAKVENEPSGGLLLHITAETEGEAASYIPKAAPTSTEFSLRTQAPPANAEYCFRRPPSWVAMKRCFPAIGPRHASGSTQN